MDREALLSVLDLRMVSRPAWVRVQVYLAVGRLKSGKRACSGK